VSSKKKKTTVGVKGNQVGGGGESVADSVGIRSDLVLPGDLDKSDHDRSADSVPRGRRERSGPPRFHRGLYYCSHLLKQCHSVVLKYYNASSMLTVSAVSLCVCT